MSRTTSTITLSGVLALPALVLALSGCTGSQPSQVLPSEISTPAPAESMDPHEGMDMGDDDDVITIGLRFMPSDITVRAGDTVTWINGEAIGHTITSGVWGDVDQATGLRGTETADGLFDHALSPKGEEGDSFSFTFTEPGVYPYFCSPHLTMNATVTVEP